MDRPFAHGQSQRQRDPHRKAPMYCKSGAEIYIDKEIIEPVEMGNKKNRKLSETVKKNPR